MALLLMLPLLPLHLTTFQGVGAVILDEFHERSLDADTALALILDCQKWARPDLR